MATEVGELEERSGKGRQTTIYPSAKVTPVELGTF